MHCYKNFAMLRRIDEVQRYDVFLETVLKRIKIFVEYYPWNQNVLNVNLSKWEKKYLPSFGGPR